MNEQPEQQFEHEPSTSVTVRPVWEVAGTTLEQLAADAADEWRQIIARDPDHRAVLANLLHVPPDSPILEALDWRIEERLKSLAVELPEKTVAWTEQVNSAVELARQNKFIQSARPVEIMVTDELLRSGITDQELKFQQDEYDHLHQRIIITSQASNALIAHELGHHLSFAKNEQRIGFRRFTPASDGQLWADRKLMLFDEGATVIWEELATSDDSRVTGREDKHDLYGWGRDVLRFIGRETGFDDQALLRAYFGHQETRQKLETAVKETWGIGLAELEDLVSFQIDRQLTLDILSGRPVTCDRPRDTIKLVMIEKYFPNVSWEK